MRGTFPLPLHPNPQMETVMTLGKPSAELAWLGERLYYNTVFAGWNPASDNFSLFVHSVKVPVSPGNAAEVARFLANITALQPDGPWQDLNDVSAILENIVRAGSGKPEVCKTKLISRTSNVRRDYRIHSQCNRKPLVLIPSNYEINQWKVNIFVRGGGGDASQKSWNHILPFSQGSRPSYNTTWEEAVIKGCTIMGYDFFL